MWPTSSGGVAPGAGPYDTRGDAAHTQWGLPSGVSMEGASFHPTHLHMQTHKLTSHDTGNAMPTHMADDWSPKDIATTGRRPRANSLASMSDQSSSDCMSLLPGSNFSSASSLDPNTRQPTLSGSSAGEAFNNHGAGSPGVSTESSGLRHGTSGGSGEATESSADSDAAFAVRRSFTDMAPKAASCLGHSDSEPSSDDTIGDSERGRRAMLGLAMSSTSAFKEKRSMRRSLSKWYNGKSRSFTSLADAQRLGGAGGLRKPEHLQVQRRQKRTMSSGNLAATMAAAAAGAGGAGGSRSRPGSGRLTPQRTSGLSGAVLNELVEAELTEMLGSSFGGGCGSAAIAIASHDPSPGRALSDPCARPAIDFNGDPSSPVGRRKSLLGSGHRAQLPEAATSDTR